MKKLSASIVSVVSKYRVFFFPNAGLKTTEWAAPSFAMRQRCRPLYVMHPASQHGVIGQKISVCEYCCHKLKCLLRRLVTWLVCTVWLVNCLLDWLVSQSTVAAMKGLGESCSGVKHRICYGVPLFFTAHFRG